MAARRLTGLTQQEMADKLNVSRTTVTGWENGAEIEEGRMNDVSRAYGASRGWIRYAEGKPPEGLASFEATPPVPKTRGTLANPADEDVKAKKDRA